MIARSALPVLAGALLGAALAWLGGAGEARAAASPWLDHDHAKVQFITGQDSISHSNTLDAGLRFQLAPGWKIYWRSPGAAGFPPALDWSASDNVAGARIDWPVPERFTLFGLETFGYKDEVVLPIALELERPGEPARLEAKLTYLVCEEICVPHDGVLRLDLPAGPGDRSIDAFLIDEARDLVPGDGQAVGLSLEQAVLREAGEDPRLEVTARSTIPFAGPDLLVEGPQGFEFAKPEVTLAEDGKLATLSLATSRNALAEGVVEGKRLTLTLTDGRRGMEQEIVTRYDAAAGATVAGPAGSDWNSLLAILGLAVLGGLILNLMPCVLPVLSIKLLSVVSKAGQEKSAVRAGFLASAAGILASFLVLAGVLIALKASGMAVGWGIQFQQPLFLAGMALVVSLFAFNLLGLFEIHLPGFLGEAAGKERGGLGGHFATGAFATLLATPCSAPFLGTAVGFALARGPFEIVLIFLALGVGLALPYLLVAAAPGLATRLPKPGAWMVWLRRVLGLALVATALWLLWVLANQVGTTAALGAGALLLAIGAVLAFGKRLASPAVAAMVAVLAVASLAVPAGFARAPIASEEAAWLPLDQAEIGRLVAEGKTVFVDVTADWCLTCKANKALVLDTRDVSERLDGPDVVRMRGDWTSPDPAITAYLTSFGRYGIPFNAVYGPGAPDGATLPELLTRERVLKALDQAGQDRIAASD
ncbi:MAG: protein-disulfide reductase DsbD domain-containing protein [Pseudomonadota bacterium]